MRMGVGEEELGEGLFFIFYLKRAKRKNGLDIKRYANNKRKQ